MLSSSWAQADPCRPTRGSDTAWAVDALSKQWTVVGSGERGVTPRATHEGITYTGKAMRADGRITDRRASAFDAASKL